MDCIQLHVTIKSGVVNINYSQDIIPLGVMCVEWYSTL